MAVLEGVAGSLSQGQLLQMVACVPAASGSERGALRHAPLASVLVHPRAHLLRHPSLRTRLAALLLQVTRSWTPCLCQGRLWTMSFIRSGHQKRAIQMLSAICCPLQA